MEPGCFGKVGKVVREAFSSLLERTRQRRGAEHRCNSIPSMQATPSLTHGRGGLGAVEVGLGISSQSCPRRRARLRASGWRTSGEETKTELEKKLRDTILDLQEKRRAQRTCWLRRPEPLPKASNKPEEHVFASDPVTAEVPQETIEAASDTHDATGVDNTNVPSCCPLRGKKAYSKMWEDTVLLGLGLGLTITSTAQSFGSLRQPGNLGMLVVPINTRRRVPVMGVRALYWRAKQMGVLIEGMEEGDGTCTGRPIPSGFEDAARAY
ncbi:uncharacterized protein LOC134445365 [Engraulis encrasicolus]|uniref:uncharacterized protein LOC134445365 n=1 Tax=Engraulis encrasicolus TaxID=184585 RepID=UPI002FD2505D